MTHNFAKYLILAVSALGLSALPALAGTCAVGDTVSTGYTCSLGSVNFDFLNVAFTPLGGVPAPVLQLDALTGISGDDYVLDFSVSVGGETTPPAAEDLLLDYTVSGGSFSQVDNSYLATGANGQSLDETVCSSDPCTANPSNELVKLDNEVGGVMYSGTFGPDSSVYITKDFNAVTSEFTDSIVSTPEPSSLGFMLIGVLGIGLVSRKFRRA